MADVGEEVGDFVVIEALIVANLGIVKRRNGERKRVTLFLVVGPVLSSSWSILILASFSGILGIKNGINCAELDGARGDGLKKWGNKVTADTPMAWLNHLLRLVD